MLKKFFVADLSLSFVELRKTLYSAVVCDALDSIGYRSQSPSVAWRHYSGDVPLMGRCKTTLWEEIEFKDPDPYALELQAVDSCTTDSVFIAAAGGSMRSGIWGELLTTAAMNQGCIGAIIDGAVRDIRPIREKSFALFAKGSCIYDSLHRQRVIAIDIPVEVGGVTMATGDLVIGDEDGIVVIPQVVERQVIEMAIQKVHAENKTRDAIRNGMKATEAYEKYGVL